MGSRKRRAAFGADAMLGIAGGTLAAASATFAVAMTLHGPVAGLGTSGAFTVFAQLAPRRTVAASDTADRGNLDLTATASIPARQLAASTLTLQSADAGTATVLVGGRSRLVRVGDAIEGVGQVLAIVPGARPVLRTTGGVFGTRR